MTRLYRHMQRLVRLAPEWLVRFRPFAVYEIRLRGMNEQLLPRAAVLPCRVNWISDSAEATALRPLTRAENIALLETRTCRAVAAWHNDRAVGCVWIARDAFEEVELGLRFELRPSEAWLFAANVDSQWRNQGVYAQLLDFISVELARSGLERILLGVTLGNEPSRRVHERHGAVRVGSIMAIRSLGFRCCFRTGQISRSVSHPITWRRAIWLSVD